MHRPGLLSLKLCTIRHISFQLLIPFICAFNKSIYHLSSIIYHLSSSFIYHHHHHHHHHHLSKENIYIYIFFAGDPQQLTYTIGRLTNGILSDISTTFDMLTWHWIWRITSRILAFLTNGSTMFYLGRARLLSLFGDLPDCCGDWLRCLGLVVAAAFPWRFRTLETGPAMGGLTKVVFFWILASKWSGTRFVTSGMDIWWSLYSCFFHMEIQWNPTLPYFLRLAFLEPPGRCAPRGVRRLFPEGLDADVGADAQWDPGVSRGQDSGRKFHPGQIQIFMGYCKL